MGMRGLGKTLAEARKLRGWSLREVEDRTKISNGYLSLMEQGKIKEPSPNMLMKLAEVYDIGYPKLMELAGYMGPKKERAATAESAGFALSSTIKDLNPEERLAVRNFINLIRGKRS